MAKRKNAKDLQNGSTKGDEDFDDQIRENPCDESQECGAPHVHADRNPVNWVVQPQRHSILWDGSDWRRNGVHFKWYLQMWYANSISWHLAISSYEQHGAEGMGGLDRMGEANAP